MLLYLSSSGKSGITDFLEEENEQAQCNKPEVVIKACGQIYFKTVCG